MKVFLELLHGLDVTAASIRMAFLTVLEYPANFAGWLLSNPIQFVVGFAAIRFAVAEFGSINGWSYGELAVLYGLSVMSHALSMIFFVNGWFMGWWVLEGDFDRLLTRPLGVVYQFFFTNINVLGVTDLIPGVLVFAYGAHAVGLRLTLPRMGFLLVLLTGAALIRGGVYLALGSSSFWTRSAVDFGACSQEIFDKTTMYPLSMYPEAVQFLLTYLIPIGWVSFYPVSALLGIENGVMDSAWAALVTLVSGIAVMLAAAALFRLGMRRYESAGN